jgi:hypothetical protein
MCVCPPLFLFFATFFLIKVLDPTTSRIENWRNRLDVYVHMIATNIRIFIVSVQIMDAFNSP